MHSGYNPSREGRSSGSSDFLLGQYLGLKSDEARYNSRITAASEYVRSPTPADGKTELP